MKLPAVPEIARIRGAEAREAIIDGVAWRYWYAGSGPALLLIHGLMGYSFSWRFNVESLAKDFTVYALDLPGCGFSERSDGLPGTLLSDAKGVLRFMEEVGLDEAGVLGTSRGGGVAILLAGLVASSSRPSRIRRLILSAPINPWSNYGKFLTRLLGSGLGRLYILHVQPHLKFMLQIYLRKLYGDARRISPGTAEGYGEGLQPQGSFQHLYKIVHSWHADLAAIEAALPNLGQLPTLLLWGSKDTAVYPSSATLLRERLMNSAIRMIHGVGHLPYEEVPAEFDKLVCEFFLRSEAMMVPSGELKAGSLGD